jgi:hypothetical protein
MRKEYDFLDHGIITTWRPGATSSFKEAALRYDFLIDAYEAERIKVISARSMFRADELPVRPNATDQRGRSFYEHMVHQCPARTSGFERRTI